MSRKKLIEAIKQEYTDAPEDIPESDLAEWLYDTIDHEYLDRGEQRVIAQVGNRFFRYHQHGAIGIEWGTLEEVEPYTEVVTKYRPK
jgi:hypothetical protein